MYNAKKEFVTVLEKTGTNSAVQWLLLDVSYQDWKYRGNNDLIAELIAEAARECIEKPWNLEIYHPLTKTAAMDRFLVQVYVRRDDGKIGVNGNTAMDMGFSALQYIYSRMDSPYDTREELQTYARRIYDILALYMVKMKNALTFWCDNDITDEEFEILIEEAFGVLDALITTESPEGL